MHKICQAIRLPGSFSFLSEQKPQNPKNFCPALSSPHIKTLPESMLEAQSSLALSKISPTQALFNTPLLNTFVEQKLLGVKSTDHLGNTPFHGAVHLGNKELLEWLIQNREGLDQINKLGHSPFHEAVLSGQMQMMQLLVNHGANLHLTDKEGTWSLHQGTALHKAVIDGNIKAVSCLLKMGFSIDTPHHKTGQTSFHLAAERGNLNVLKLLKLEGANPNAVSSLGDTPLHLAAKNGHFNTVCWLVNNGADITMTNLKGCSALHAAAETGTVDIVKALILTGADDKASDATGDSLVHAAARTNNTSVLEYLLEQGHNPDFKNSTGMTAMHWASAHGHRATIELLVHYGADVNATDASLETPLHYSFMFDQQDKGLTSTLLNLGANPDALNRTFKTPAELSI